MGKSIKFIALVSLVVCCVASTSEAQLAFHTDTNTNSFTLKAPGLQQTFTRYFGGQQGGPLQAQSTQQKQQVAPASYQPTQQALQSFYDALQQQDQQQAQYLSAPEYAAYLQQTQAAQAAQAQHQYQQTQFAAGQQNQAAAPSKASPEALRQNSNLLGVAYSPSNQVSHVKFSSGDLAYNF